MLNRVKFTLIEDGVLRVRIRIDRSYAVFACDRRCPYTIIQCLNTTVI